MNPRYSIERALGRSELPPPSRALVRVLCERIDARTGRIAPQHSPSIARLAADTGYHRATVCRHLALLDAAGWIARRRPAGPAALRRQETTSYELRVPGGLSHTATGGGRSVRQGAVAEGAEASRSARHSQTGTERLTECDDKSSPSWDGDDRARAELAEIARDELRALTGRPVTLRQGADAARLVLAGREVRDPAAYLRAALRDAPGRYAPASRQPPPVAELPTASEIDEAMRARGIVVAE